MLWLCVTYIEYYVLDGHTWNVYRLLSLAVANSKLRKHLSTRIFNIRLDLDLHYDENDLYERDTILKKSMAN